MLKTVKGFFLNEKAILFVIVFNALLLFLQESGIDNPFVNTLDVCCSIIFVIEMIVKLVEYGFKGYWSSGWNRLDGILVILSIPSLIFYFMPDINLDLSFLLVLRVLRVFRFFRLVHAFPGFSQLVKNAVVAMKRSYAVFIGLLIMIITFAMIGCGLFKDICPEYFSTPLDAIYSTFRIFTGEGWNEIPDAVSQGVSPVWGHLVRLYFCFILILGCIVGMSLLNSIFVDAMVSDNDEETQKKLESIEASLEEIKKKLDCDNPEC